MTTETLQPVAPTLPSVFDNKTDIRGMLEEEIKFLLTLSMSEMESPPSALTRPVKATELERVLTEEFKVTPLPFALAVIVKRLSAMCPDMQFNPGLLVLLTHLASNPAICVMLAYSLYRETQKLGRPVTINDFCMDLCPLGVPTEAAFSAYWDTQKGKTRNEPDNWIDTRAVWA